MYCTLSSILAVEGRAGHLPPELTRPSLAFFFIEHAFYVIDRCAGECVCLGVVWVD